MSADCNHIVDILNRDGTGRPDLGLGHLSPDKVKLQDFELGDWYAFALNFSRHVHYYTKESEKKPVGDWKNFFGKILKDTSWLNDVSDQKKLEILKASFDDFLVEKAQTKDLTPHLTLFVCFIKLLQITQDRFNKLTKRHLDFYYQEILQMEKEPLKPDHVYLIFELAKNLSNMKLDKGTALDGGKDTEGTKRTYVTAEETIINKAQVQALKSVFNDVIIDKAAIHQLDTSDQTGTMVMAPIANSYDGQGADFPKESQKWWPFGYTKNCNASTQMPSLPSARLGFTIGSELLYLAEGNRWITMILQFEKDILDAPISIDQLKQAIKPELTGEKGWIGAETFVIENEPAFIDDPIGNHKIILQINLDESAEAVVGYDAEIHGGNYTVQSPLIRVLFRIENKEGYNLYRLLNENPLQLVTIQTDVFDVQQIRIENDLGALNPSKPFYPFGPRALKGASFSLSYGEAMSKPLKEINFSMDYLNTPDDFAEHYVAYNAAPVHKEIKESLKKEQAKESPKFNKTVIADYYDSKMEKLKDSALPNQMVSLGHTVTGDDYFKVNKYPDDDAESLSLFQKNGAAYSSAFSFNNPKWSAGDEKSLKISLVNSFLHEKYPHYFTIAAIEGKDGISDPSELPNEPYTPLSENLRLNYSASDTIDFRSESADKNIHLIHEEPFGHTAVFSPEQTTPTKQVLLVPTFCHGGELYIGLDSALPLQQITLLFQFLEGSENPVAKDIFTGKQQIKWDYLKENAWEEIKSSDILLNQSPRFLKSGVFRFSLPKDATKENTKLPAGLHWIRASMKKPYDVVCQLVDIKAQAVEAVFEDKGNTGDHLTNGLPAGSISKLQQRISSIKSLSQPYSSFGGKAQEEDDSYYRRVSERLRHKKRAITLWDYEHLILQHFPKVYKVKCLNHTCEQAFQSPGNVTIILVPDTVKQAVYDIYQPRVSQATLNEVSSFINELNSFHVQAKVINPNYEEVKVDTKVKFREGFDVSFYEIQLQEDLKRLLSPWAYDQNVTVQFGVTLHRSQLIHYMEELPYVDYLEDVKLKKRNPSSPPCSPSFEEVSTKDYIRPLNPKSILVSAKSHKVTPITETCSSEPQETQEKCQH
ncbi:baseplate J/gp47 family protein [Echinicola vietnamensis]|uniref:Baseplate J-like protein n=1 Tax=Echinicola vietnamensis (strain DSM 17526 / LMG 23754 / KMM 6221) TaxID=926556 RepID=L0G4P7_ECHVK|nr:baseplate J/gp47 family protein [Echinicola vietnamensis]AGA79805.1 Baseplate J-like protein [Echinicola vietnamensis DSM 17526]